MVLNIQAGNTSLDQTKGPLMPKSRFEDLKGAQFTKDLQKGTPMLSGNLGSVVLWSDKALEAGNLELESKLWDFVDLWLGANYLMYMLQFLHP